MTAPHVLVVDDEPDIRALVREILVDEGYSVAIAENGEAARRTRRERRPDVVLLDIWMPDIDGISLLKEWSSEEGFNTPVIMMSGHGTVETAVEATRLGAYDFLEKPLSLAKLLLTIRHALDNASLRRENIGLRRHVQPLVQPLGRSVVMRQLREQVERIAQTDAWVLITGEAGSGKRLFARYLHDNSTRRSGPFIEVNGAALADSGARELFGIEDGSAVRYGLLEQASAGTLFLSEIGELSRDIQLRLMGALRGQMITRVGGTAPVRIDVRVVAATQSDLAQAVRVGRFREDLYYQLNVVPVRVPSLREHAEDVPELLAYYVDYFVEHDGLPFRRFAVAAQNRLRHYAWPGNVRELKNLVQRLLILGAQEDIGAEEVEATLGTPLERVSPPREPAEFDLPLREAREQFERAYLDYHLRRAEGNISQVAKMAGVERTHLYRKLKALGLGARDDE